MKKISGLCLLSLAVLTANQSMAGDEPSDLERAGDIIQILLPVAAYGKTFVDDDEEGRMQFYKAGGTTLVTIHTLKAAARKLRPNGSNNSSFPSGHTGASFMGAGFFHQRYGLKWGVPAYALAGIVGYSRIEAQKHFADDVLAGANFAMLANLYFVTERESDVSIQPFNQDGAQGISLSVSDQYIDKQRTQVTLKPSKFRYQFSFGPSYLDENRINVPAGVGEGIKLDAFNNADNRLTTAMSHIFYQHNDKNMFTASFIPYETRDVVVASPSTQIDGVSFVDGETILGSYRFYETSIGWRYGIINANDFKVNLGVDGSLQRTIVTIASDTQTSKSGDWTTMVVPALDLEYEINHRLTAFAKATGASYSNKKLLTTEIGLRWQLDEQWDVGGKYSSFDRQVRDSDFENHVQLQSLLVDIGYRF